MTADSSRHALYAIPESVYGTCPATPAFNTVRNTQCNLALAKGAVKSAELYPDRQTRNFKTGTHSVGGNITGELSYGTYDAYIEACLQGTWAAKFAPYIASTISAAASDNSINDSANAFPALEPGDKITIAGFTGGSTTANQSDLTVVSRTASKIVVSGGIAFIDDAAGEAVTITTLTNRVLSQSTRKSFSFMRNFSDLPNSDPSNPWHLFTGVELNTMSLTVAAGDKNVIIEFGVMGQDEAISASGVSGQTIVAATTSVPIDTFKGTVNEGGSAIGTVTEITIKYTNGLTAKPVVGTPLGLQASDGVSDVTGQLTVYFADSSLAKKFINGTLSSLDFTLKDAAGNAIRIQIPNLIYTGESEDVKGSGPITLVLPYQGLYSAAFASNIVIDRAAA